MKFLQQMFSVKNEDCHKTLRILGLKMKFRRKEGKLLKSVENTDDLNEFRFYQAVNKTKEAALKAKIRETHKCKVVFIITSMAKFGMETIYRAMEESDLFEPEILVCTNDSGFTLTNSEENHFKTCKFFASQNGEQVWQDALKTCEILKSYGYKVTLGYDKETRKPAGLEALKPDIVFITSPQLYRWSYYKNQYLNFNFLTCFIPYGIHIANNFIYQYDWKTVNQCWKQFISLGYDLSILCNKSKYQGINAVLTGYPKLDEYKKEYYKIPEKINNNKKTVIYAPHWTITAPDNVNKLWWSTFNLYSSLFAELREKYHDINWVFKPHPNLVYAIINEKDNPDVMNYEEYLQYIKDWDEAPNGLYLNSFEYINLFKHSDLLITDCGSFIGEWLPSKHPCIYLLNPKSENWRNNYNSLANKILDTYYLCRNKEEILENFEKIILNNIDEKKDARLQILDEEFDYIGCAGEKIVKYLESVLTD